MAACIRLISSMATKGLLADLASAPDNPAAVQVKSVGGVDAVRRVQAGEAFDGVVLAADAVDKLIASGHVLPERIDVVQSGVAAAVRQGAAMPSIDSEGALRQAVLAAASIGYSTGPSGVQLLQLFERWGLADTLRPRSVQAPPGVPVGSLVARGEVELGFQQLSELIGLPGISVLGPMPAPVQIVTVFAAGVATASREPDLARALLTGWTARAFDTVKQRHGMAPASR